METDALLTTTGEVRPEWIDYNGHLMDGFYAVAFSAVTDRFLEAIGFGPDYPAATGHSVYTLESHLVYLREVRAGARLRYTTQLLDYDDRRIHIVHSVAEDGADGPAATNELLLTHVRQAPAGSAAMPPEPLARLGRLARAHAGHPPPPQVGRRVALRRTAAPPPAPGVAPALTAELASRLARLALSGITQEYPVSPGHVLTDAGDGRRPRELHPAFYGCFDWHSAVHSHWALVRLLRLLRLLPALPEAAAARAALGAHLTDANLRAEAGYFAEPGRSAFERPYGWAWLLKLAEELLGWDDPDARRWSAAVAPLAALIARRYLEFLPRLTYPVRSGVHSSTAFGLTFALDYALAAGHGPLRDALVARSLDYFGADRDGPAAWEPGGGDFLSPCLAEADLMRRVLPAPQFGAWLAGFLPGLADGRPPQLLTPAVVSDRGDGQIVHLDGLNLSRAWALWGVAGALGPGDRRRPALLAAAGRHAAAGLEGVGSGDYMGDHWLGSFALYALGCAPAGPQA